MNESANGSDVVETVRQALREVLDPELGIDVVALGLVYGIRVEGDRLVVEMTLTTPGCPVSESLPSQALTVASDAAAGTGLSVDLDIVWDPPWTPDMLEPRAAERLGFGSR